MDHTNLHKEIDLIQNCISRMANNSFLLKGWAISIIAVVIAISDARNNPFFLFCCIWVPLICFWYLDAFFLHAEKMYRKMYEWVLRERPKNNVEYLYDLNPHRFEKGVDGFCKVMFSKTLCVFYGIPLLIITLILLYQLFGEWFRQLICNC